MDFSKILGQAQELQKKIKEAQGNIQHIRVEGESGAGLVKAMVNGNKQVLSLDIDESLMSADKKKVIEDLSIAAINNALTKVEPLVQEEIKKHTGGIPNIPGFDLSNLFNK